MIVKKVNRDIKEKINRFELKALRKDGHASKAHT